MLIRTALAHGVNDKTRSDDDLILVRLHRVFPSAVVMLFRKESC